MTPSSWASAVDKGSRLQVLREDGGRAFFAGSHEAPVLATIAPNAPQRRATRIFVLALLASALLTWPFASINLPALPSLVPTLAAALFVNYVVTAILLLGQYSILRRPALLIIANGYVFSGLMVVEHALAFPGAFAPSGLNGAGPQSAVWLYDFWHAGLPIAAIGYVLLNNSERTIRTNSTRLIITSVAATVVLAAALFWFFTRHSDLLPVTYVDAQPISLFRRMIGGVVDAAISGVALCVVWIRRRSLLDEMLVIALSAIFIELLLSAVLPGERYNVAWYVARFYHVVAATVVMSVLLTEKTRLYASIVEANSLLRGERLLLRAAEETARENEQRYRQVQTEVAHANRVAAIGQLSASIGHEINQPLSGIVTNAGTASLWLQAEPPNIPQALSALARVVRDGKRVGDVVDRIRALIKKAPPQTSKMDINEAILEVIGLTRGEAVKNSVLVQTHLSENLPLILGDRVQLQQVIVNLTMNAIEATSAIDGGPREVQIDTARTGASVLISVRDSGPGLDPENIERIFTAFYTTKPSGLGMGLAICRSIVEGHGGHLWATPGAPRGAVLQFTLPSGTVTAL